MNSMSAVKAIVFQLSVSGVLDGQQHSRGVGNGGFALAFQLHPSSKKVVLLPLTRRVWVFFLPYSFSSEIAHIYNSEVNSLTFCYLFVAWAQSCHLFITNYLDQIPCELLTWKTLYFLELSILFIVIVTFQCFFIACALEYKIPQWIFSILAQCGTVVG